MELKYELLVCTGDFLLDRGISDRLTAEEWKYLRANRTRRRKILSSRFLSCLFTSRARLVLLDEINSRNFVVALWELLLNLVAMKYYQKKKKLYGMMYIEALWCSSGSPDA